jgi:pilus assembly protein Flp/PilA
MSHEEDQMNTITLKIYTVLCGLLKREEGQDLIEYALIAALIALAAVAGLSKMGGLMQVIYNSFSNAIAGAT